VVLVFASGTIVRISKIAIAGRKRMNRKNSDRNRPIVPASMPKSHRVGAYMSHDEGRKSRCRLVTMMMNRSSHIPTFTRRESRNSRGMLSRTLRNQNSWIMQALMAMSDQ
jgi:hypothetical protein